MAMIKTQPFKPVLNEDTEYFDIRVCDDVILGPGVEDITKQILYHLGIDCTVSLVTVHAHSDRDFNVRITIHAIQENDDGT